MKSRLVKIVSLSLMSFSFLSGCSGEGIVQLKNRDNKYYDCFYVFDEVTNKMVTYSAYAGDVITSFWDKELEGVTKVIKEYDSKRNIFFEGLTIKYANGDNVNLNGDLYTELKKYAEKHDFDYVKNVKTTDTMREVDRGYVIHMNYTPIYYKVNYHNLEGATFNGQATYTYKQYDLGEPSKPYHTFNGWKDVNGNELDFSNGGNLDAYASFEVTQYTITYIDWRKQELTEEEYPDFKRTFTHFDEPFDLPVVEKPGTKYNCWFMFDTNAEVYINLPLTRFVPGQYGDNVTLRLSTTDLKNAFLFYDEEGTLINSYVMDGYSLDKAPSIPNKNGCSGEWVPYYSDDDYTASDIPGYEECDNIYRFQIKYTHNLYTVSIYECIDGYTPKLVTSKECEDGEPISNYLPVKKAETYFANYYYDENGTKIIDKEDVVKSDTSIYLKYYNNNSLKNISNKFDLLNALNSKDVYQLTSDIDMGGEILKPINVFNNVIFGNGHKITNFKLKESNDAYFININNGVLDNIIFSDFSLEYHRSLFGDINLNVLTKTNNGTLRDIQIQNASITYNYTSNSADFTASVKTAVFANTNNGLIENCSMNNVTINNSLSSKYGILYLGLKEHQTVSLSASNVCITNNGVIDSYIESQVSNTHKFVTSKIDGYDSFSYVNSNGSFGDISITNTGIIRDSVCGSDNNIDMTALIDGTSSVGVSGTISYGGVSTFNTGSIKNTVNQSSNLYYRALDGYDLNQHYDGNYDLENHIGGLVCSNDGTISNSANYQDISITGTNLKVGGFVYSNSQTGHISNCYNNNTITSIYENTTLSGEGVIAFAGFAYDNKGDIHHSVTSFTYDNDRDSIINNSAVAGFVYSSSSTADMRYNITSFTLSTKYFKKLGKFAITNVYGVSYMNKYVIDDTYLTSVEQGYIDNIAPIDLYDSNYLSYLELEMYYSKTYWNLISHSLPVLKVGGNN